MPRQDAPALMLVRLKPFNPRRGYVLKTYVDGPTGSVFREERGWYEVEADFAERLREIRSRPDREESPAAFDVCTRAQALELERKIRREQQERASAHDPLSVEGASRDHLGGRAPRYPAARDTGTLTTADLPGNQSPLRGPLHDEPADAGDLESEDLAAEVAQASKRPSVPPVSRRPGGRPAGKAKAAAVPGAPIQGSILPPAAPSEEGIEG